LLGIDVNADSTWVFHHGIRSHARLLAKFVTG
jgi:hypothetical protein